MAHDEKLREVWRLHDGERLSIPQIAGMMRIGERDVHACIIEVWCMTNSDRVAVGVKAVRGWEDA